MHLLKKIHPTASEGLVFGGLKQNKSKRPKNRTFNCRRTKKIVDIDHKTILSAFSHENLLSLCTSI